MNLFGLKDEDLDVDFDEEVVPRKRSKQPYKEATVRPPTMREARAKLESSGLFSLSNDDLGKPPLDELYPTQAEVVAGVGSNGLTSVSSFTGCGGSMTGFAMAGWEDKASIEFVEAARDTLASNYKSYVLDPVFVMEIAREVASDMDLDFKIRSVKDEKVQATDETEVTFNDEDSDASTETVVEAPVDLHASRAVFYWKPKKVKGKKVDIGLDWESTLLSLGGNLSREFRKEVSRRAFERCEKEEGIAIWGDDIRGLDGSELIKHLGIERGELDCYEGSPPCKSFSMSGLRESGWGQVLHYSDERNQRTDDLFLEALRVLDDMRPRSFVFENVAGLTMGSAAEDVLKPMMAALAEMGYNSEARELNASSFDVPQSRPRVIIQGIRNDHYDKETGLPLYPVWPEVSANTYSVKDALDATERLDANTEEYLKKSSLEKYETGKIWKQLPIGSAPENKAYQMIRCHPDMPAPTITATSAGNQPAAGPTHPFECRKFTIPEYKFLFSFPRDYVFTGNIDQQGERMGRSVPPFMMKAIAGALADNLKNAEIRS